MRCLLVGNYGAGNVGDEALRAYFLEAFPEVEWQVLSAAPTGKELPRLPSGIRSFLRFDWLKTVRAYRSCDGVVLGGGSLFTESESVRACVLWGLHVWLAVRCGKPVYLAFQGIGPFRSKVGEWCARFAVRNSCFLSVRDEASAARIEGWMKSIKVVHTFDPAFLLFRSHKNVSGAKNVFMIIPRKNSTKSFAETVRTRMQKMAPEHVRILLMEPSQEKTVLTEMRSLLPDEIAPEVHDAETVDGLLSGFADASFVLTQRYHGGMAALAMGVPYETVPQAPGDKLSTLQGLTGADADGLAKLALHGEEQLRYTLRSHGH